MSAPGDLTYDAFLDGRVHVWQPQSGYRAATDPVFLAAACPARAGDRVLELGCGAGVAALCLKHRVPGIDVLGVERQPFYAELARRNRLSVVEADLADLPPDLRQRAFDQIIANPPYFGPGTAAQDAGREEANREVTPLAAWLTTAHARLRPKGWLTIIHRAERLPDLLRAMDGFGSITALPLAARSGRSANRIILRARKGARGPFTLLPPFLIHEGAAHGADGDDYSPLARAVLREGAALPFS